MGWGLKPNLWFSISETGGPGSGCERGSGRGGWPWRAKGSKNKEHYPSLAHTLAPFWELAIDQALWQIASQWGCFLPWARELYRAEALT